MLVPMRSIICIIIKVQICAIKIVEDTEIEQVRFGKMILNMNQPRGR